MTDVTVILSLYKRPYCLEKQLRAIHSQTIRPTEIILIKNPADGVRMPDISDELLKNVTIVEINRNIGVWGRFAIGLMAKTTYVNIIDDDTIPGCKWLENCIDSMNTREGIYSTIGIKFPNPNYGFYLDNRIGWDRPNSQIEQVDMGCHSWFFKREWLSFFWEFIPDYNENLRNGEDMHLSFVGQKHGIPTLIPPHPPGQYDMFGSIPSSAWEYGGDANATALDDSIAAKFNIFLQILRAKGFKLMCEI